MTTLDQAITNGDPDAIGYQAAIAAGVTSAMAAAAATLSIRYPGILLPVIDSGGLGGGAGSLAHDVVVAATEITGIDDLAGV